MIVYSLDSRHQLNQVLGIVLLNIIHSFFSESQIGVLLFLLFVLSIVFVLLFHALPCLTMKTYYYIVSIFSLRGPYA